MFFGVFSSFFKANAIATVTTAGRLPRAGTLQLPIALSFDQLGGKHRKYARKWLPLSERRLR